MVIYKTIFMQIAVPGPYLNFNVKNVLHMHKSMFDFLKPAYWSRG